VDQGPLFVADPEITWDGGLLARAAALALSAYDPVADAAALDHVLAAAAFVQRDGGADEDVAAAFLHDALEDGKLTLETISARTDARVAAVVAALTEDTSIEDYGARKERLRRTVAGGGPSVARVFGADKIARLEHLRAAGEALDPERLDHFAQSVALLDGLDVPASWKRTLADDLSELRSRSRRGPARRRPA
jgi:hypothetical protein